MADINDLKTSITEMDDHGATEVVREIRARRREELLNSSTKKKRKSSKTKKKKPETKKDISAMLSKLSPEQSKEMLEILGGTDED